MVIPHFQARMAISELEFLYPEINTTKLILADTLTSFYVRKQTIYTFNLESYNFLIVNINSGEGTVPSVNVCKT